MITNDSKQAIKFEILNLEEKLNKLKTKKSVVKAELDFINARIDSVQATIYEMKKDV